MEFRENPHIRNIANILRSIGERIEGNLICDIDPEHYVIHRNLAKIRNLQTLALGKKRICEIGVNAGHSLLLMLLVNPEAEYTLFDLGNHRYTRPCIDYIRSQFPNTVIEISYGTSVETIPEYIRLGSDKKYDLCHLDGGHTFEVFSEDYANVKKMLMPNGIVIFDDYDLSQIAQFVNSKVAAGEIVEFVDPSLMKTGLHFIYSVVPILNTP